MYMLRNEAGEMKIYKHLQIRPRKGFLIKVVKPAAEKTIRELNTATNRFRDITFDRVYKIYKVHNVTQALIKDDVGNIVQLYPSQYHIIEEVSVTDLKIMENEKKGLFPS
ncbi:hypothetical protein [Bacillus testis]|uniref:hypothetical protein n=1 Tax=Bacillus testis TaxID=1622072 RepID=UPI00067EAF91|nr:hypothetical protein [Bacillus testis]